MTHHKTVVIGFLAASFAFAQAPVISASGFTNAASGDNTGIAQGSYFVLYGQNLGAVAGPASYPFQTTLANRQVHIKSLVDNKTYDAYLYYAAPGQINGIMPSNVPIGQAQVSVTVNGTTVTASGSITIEQTHVGIFTFLSQPNGQAIVQNYESPASQPLNRFLKPATQGQTLILWVTGVGAYTQGPDNVAPQAGNISDKLEVVIGGVSVKPFYAGRAPGDAGVDQINFTLPNDGSIPDGCAVPILVRWPGTGGVPRSSNPAIFSKATSTSVCQHPFGLSTSQLATLDAGGSVSAGLLQFQRTRINFVPGGLASGIEDSAYGAFAKMSANGTPLAQTALDAPLSLANGSCIVFGTALQSAALNTATSTEVFPGKGALDAGRTISLSGPGGTMNVDGSNGSYAAQLATASIIAVPGVPPITQGQTFLSPGTWAFRAPGGRDVGAFTAPASVSGLLEMADADRFLSMTRGQPLTFRWSNAGTGPNDTVTLKGVVFGTLANATTNVGIFECRAAAGDNTFTVPASITGQLPSDATVGDFFVIGVSWPGTFSAPLVAGGNLDSGVVSATVIDVWAAGVK